MNDIANRLKTAREKSGFETAAAACERFGWKYPTYSAHENGHRGLRNIALVRYAKAFRVDPNWLLTGNKAQPNSTEAMPKVKGFAEPDVAIFENQQGDLMGRMVLMAQSTVGKSLAYIAQRDATHFSILAGDALVLDTHGAITDGDTCVVQIVDNQTAANITTVRQVMNGRLIPEPFRSRIDVIDQKFSIIGKIHTIVRSIQ